MAPFELTDPHGLQQYPLTDPIDLLYALSFDQVCYAYSPSAEPMAETQPLDYGIRNMVMSSTMHIHIDTMIWPPASVLQSNIGPKAIMDKAQWGGMSHETKEDTVEEQIFLSKIPKAIHMCDLFGCGARFNRRGHLRRHQKT